MRVFTVPEVELDKSGRRVKHSIIRFCGTVSILAIKKDPTLCNDLNSSNYGGIFNTGIVYSINSNNKTNSLCVSCER